MMTITLRTTSNRSMGELNKYSDELSISCYEGRNEATLSDEKLKTVVFDGELFYKFWNEFNQINFNRILLEGRGWTDEEGFDLTVELMSGSYVSSITLWCPMEEAYKRRGWTECEKIMSIVNEMLEETERLGFSLNDYAEPSDYEYDDLFDEDEEDEDEDWYYDVGDDMDFLPRDAVYSVQIELRQLKKVDDVYLMTVAVRDPETGEYQIFEEKVKEGSVLYWDGLEPGVVCFAGPDIVPVKLTVKEVSEKSICFRKEYDEEE